MGFTLYPVDVSVSSPLPGYGTRSTFLHLAQRTGGKAMLGDRRESALQHTVEDTRSYYWLGFAAERARDDASRRIEVQVLRPGLEARTRQGYLDLSLEAEPSPNGLVGYDTSLTLRRIEQDVIVSVFDPLSGNLLASRMEIDPRVLLD